MNKSKSLGLMVWLNIMFYLKNFSINYFLKFAKPEMKSKINNKEKSSIAYEPWNHFYFFFFIFYLIRIIDISITLYSVSVFYRHKVKQTLYKYIKSDKTQFFILYQYMHKIIITYIEMVAPLRIKNNKIKIIMINYVYCIK